MCHKRSWPCKGLAAKGHDRGYHSLFTSFSSALHGDVTFHILAKGLMILLPKLRPPRQSLESLGQGQGATARGALAVDSFHSQLGYARVFGGLPTTNNWPGYFPRIGVRKYKKLLRSSSRLKRIKEV